MNVITFEATPNIAVIKYWGKRDDVLILPTNSSISMTLDSLKTRTSVMFDPKLKSDELWLNGKEVDLTGDSEASERLKQLDVIREKAGIKEKARIVSINCFPTAAGFASSASGLAALACAASKAAGLKLSTAELSVLARLGSGSASRSVLGGFVEWKKGEKIDGSDSFAVQLAPALHWKEMRVVSVVVSSGKKKISSRVGMKQTVANSVLFKSRLEYLPKTIGEMETAIKQKDFEKFALLAMRDSNNMHAVMLDTQPPIIYLNDKSKMLIELVNEINETAGKIIAGYTFDAGPNCHIYTLEENVKTITTALQKIEGIEKIVVSKPGNGPQELSDAASHLIDPSNGKPREHYFDESKNAIVVKL
ncbi:MAG: diphosphomevalonate decarboxylase [Candidatus Micrarchaeota archaeon]